jgi:hypothetical protein
MTDHRLMAEMDAVEITDNEYRAPCVGGQAVRVTENSHWSASAPTQPDPMALPDRERKSAGQSLRS